MLTQGKKTTRVDVKDTGAYLGGDAPAGHAEREGWEGVVSCQGPDSFHTTSSTLTLASPSSFISESIVFFFFHDPLKVDYWIKVKNRSSPMVIC